MLPVPVKQRRYRQHGLSLVELMVALTLGLFLVAGILQAFVGSRQASNVVAVQSETQEAARFGFFFINNMVRQAGYVNAGEPSGEPDQFARTLVAKVKAALQTGSGTNRGSGSFIAAVWPPQLPFVESAVVAGEDSFSGRGVTGVSVKAGSDMLAVRLMGEEDPGRPDILDCEGVPIDRDRAATVMFFISDDNQLYCQVDARHSVPLVAGIEEMQVEYGVASTSSGQQAFLVDRYVAASAMSSTDWPAVMSVRVALQTRSENAALDQVAQTLYLLDPSDAKNYSDGRARQVYSQTIALRGNLSN